MQNSFFISPSGSFIYYHNGIRGVAFFSELRGGKVTLNSKNAIGGIYSITLYHAIIQVIENDNY